MLDVDTYHRPLVSFGPNLLWLRLNCVGQARFRFGEEILKALTPFLTDLYASRCARPLCRLAAILAATLCFASFVFAFVSSPVRARLRCVGEFHAAGVFACFIVIACTATIDILTA